jgi:plasmid stability protein
MPELSIKNIPADIVGRLEQRAARNHRSLQGELMAIITAAARESQALSVSDLLGAVQASGLKTPAEAAAIIRGDRDEPPNRTGTLTSPHSPG